MKIHFFITTICLVAACELYSQQNNTAPEILIPYRYKKLWGYCDTLGRIKIAPEYDKVEFLNDGIHLPVTKNKKKTILDAGGKPVIGYYDNYGSLEIGAGYGVLNKYGLLETGAYRWVLNNGKAGVIGVNGDTALPIVYDKLFYSKSTSEYRSGKAALIGKIANRYFLISFYDKYRNLLPRPETTEIPALQTDPLVLWQNDAAPGFPPEAEPLFDAEQASYALTTERQQSIRQNLHVDSIEKTPFQILETGKKTPYYRVYKSKKVGFWSHDYFVFPEYTAIRRGLYSKIAFIAKRGVKFGVIDENGEPLLPFEYTSISNSDWGIFIVTKGSKSGVVILDNSYPDIKCLYDKIELFRMLTISQNWRFALFKVIQNGREGFVGENGIEYFKE